MKILKTNPSPFFFSEKDIFCGERNSPNGSPIARCLKRKLQLTDVEASTLAADRQHVFFRKAERLGWIKTPPVLADTIQVFDNGGGLKVGLEFWLAIETTEESVPLPDIEFIRQDGVKNAKHPQKPRLLSSP